MPQPSPSPSVRPTAERVQRGQRSTLVGVGANLLLAMVKGAAGVLGHSYALIADAIESASDIFTSLFVWLGLRAAAREPDENHPYGHGKAEPLASLLVAGALVLAAGIIVWQSIGHILTPHKIPSPFTLLVLGGVVIVKEWLFRHIDQVGEEVGSGAVKADAWHHRSDAITSLTAFVGISIAIIGGPGFESADDWAAIGASLIIVFNAYHIFRPALGEIMDEAPAGTWPEDVARVARTVPGVLGTEKCIVRKMGFEYFVDLHVLVDGDISVREGHAVAHAVKDAVIAQLPAIYDVLVHIEPEDWHQ
ncbi:cation diffusion facilitator family transporter [Hymenobacter edaphi]|uniref:Cation-efflux pump n=1 Tax=Hymenobacter edaphi TaxID=2211146 RepID=A0A328BVR2_9BACT|nr:cation diffusion facilitator family transporter [Hymenobacter edaphi]RAK70601.1 cation-efflux pump [Hymenobacter edaphi]